MKGTTAVTTSRCLELLFAEVLGFVGICGTGIWSGGAGGTGTGIGILLLIVESDCGVTDA